ncbi:MAG TPA: DUF4159 domain-containing protein [Candidatus Eisenbacteria bacterium]|nr:DUF4159 domain-containing protein [Candidatus Eisenbacteria bacterium]
MRIPVLLMLPVLCGLLVSVPAAAEPSQSGFVLARLKYGGGGDWYQGSTKNLLRALRERTSVPVSRNDEAQVELSDPDLYKYPFLYMNGHGTVRFSELEAARLREYLLAGGFLFANDDYGMDQSFRRELRKVFPEHELVELPFDHPIYHCFYDLPRGIPKIHEHDAKPAQGLAILHNGRVVLFYAFESDIGDGFEDPTVHGDPAPIREEALKMGVNIVLYAMTH